MNADALDALTERVVSAIFEVFNTLGAEFLGESLRPRFDQSTNPPPHPGWRCKLHLRSVIKVSTSGNTRDLLGEDVLVVGLKCVDRRDTAQCSAAQHGFWSELYPAAGTVK